MLWIGIPYLVSAIGSGIAPEVYSFIAARFVGGLGVGISTVAAPLYIPEIAPPAKRGRLTGMFRFNIVLGILIAFLSNSPIAGTGGNDWRWMLGSSTHWIFAAILTTAFPKMVTSFAPGTVFLFFAGMMVLHLMWVILMVPETKGVPLEELEEKLGL